jgi:hypothetical protein
MIRKLFIVTRSDLSPGQQAVQGQHALMEFMVHHPGVAMAWYRESNTLAFLAAPDEASLGVLLKKARRRDIPTAAFHEPDRNNEMTAIVLDHAAHGLVSNLPLALSERGLSSVAAAADSKTASRRFDPDSPHNMRIGT